jgi:heterodisulfide reductase subunit A-like polyferredoxin
MGGGGLKGVLIIGGGTAGISAASTLSRFGIASTIVEKGPCIGGLANELACKGDRECVRCDVCLAVDSVTSALQDGKIKVITGAKVDLLEREVGRYRATLELHHKDIDDKLCDRCGRCTDACPSNAVLRHATRDGAVYRIDQDRCGHDSTDCQGCADACPRSAIDLDGEVETWQVEADAIILATGSTAFDPKLDVRLGYGTVNGVITSLQAEQSVNATGHLPDPLGLGVGKIAFIQCVGSRDPHLGAQLCSKVCCKYAMKLAKQATMADPKLEVSIFFMDWRPTDRSDDLLAWSRSTEKVKAVRSRPSEIFTGEDGRPTIRFASPGDEAISESAFDLVILSLGLRPNPDNALMADMLGARLNPHGFFFGEGKMVNALEAKGIFFSGACAGPKDIEESAMDGASAALKAARYLEASN